MYSLFNNIEHQGNLHVLRINCSAPNISQFAQCTYQSKLYLFFGKTSKTIVDTIYEFNPFTYKWTLLPKSKSQQTKC